MAFNNGENFVQIGEARLWSVCTGGGIPTLVFNGGPGCDDYLGTVAEMIEDRCRVIRFEPRGCGRSSRDKNYDLQTLLNDADSVREAYGHERVLLLGHSHGPCVALAYAMRFPERVIGMIGIAGGKVVDDRSWSAEYHAMKETEDTGGFVFDADPDVNRQGNDSWKAYCRRPELFGDLARLRAKAAFINGSHDIRPNWPTQQLAHLIPKAKYAEIDGAAHFIWLTHQAELRAELHKGIDFILDD
ncbi:MAG: alpha/beta hydrolase [Akkermansiaceae bacterium]|nr:alpha/beta hydrolase [Armatimonadota bacterium]